MLIKDAAGNAVAEKPLIELPDAVMLTRSIEVKAFDLEKRTAEFVASTDVVDAHDEIVDQSTWRLDDYLKNPVVLFAHQSRELPIGQSVDVGVRGGQLECRVQFATEDMNPLAEQVWKMVQAKFLRAVSVGFIPRTYRWEMRDGVEVWVWADCVLKEISVTPVPANPEALAKMKSMALAERQSRARPPARAGNRSMTPAVLAGGNTTPDPHVAEPGQKAAMPMLTEAEIKALQDKLDKSLLSIAELRLEAKTATDAAEKAAAALATAESHVRTLTTERTALEAQAKTLADDRDAQKARADKAEGELIELEVEGIVGKTITPVEKPMFVELRKSNHDLFKSMVGQRSPLNLDKAVIAGKDETKSVANALDGNTDDIVAEANRLGA